VSLYDNLAIKFKGRTWLFYSEL